DEPLLGEVEVKDAVARLGPPGGANVVLARELPRDRGLAVVGLLTREDEVVARERRPPRVDRVAARDRVERVDRERSRAVRGRQEVGVDAESLARRHPRALVDAVRPHDLRGRGHPARELRVGEGDLGRRAQRLEELATTDREDSARAPDLLLLLRERDW